MKYTLCEAIQEAIVRTGSYTPDAIAQVINQLGLYKKVVNEERVLREVRKNKRKFNIKISNK